MGPRVCSAAMGIAGIDPDELLTLLRDPNAESRQIAEAAGVPREEVGRAARLVHAIAKAKPEDIASLPQVLAQAVLRAAASAGRADILAAVAAGPAKEAAKEAKRALHMLRVRGVAVPEVARQQPAPAPAVPEPEMPCYASLVDGQGERAVWLARAVPGKGVEVAQAILSDTEGLLSLQVGYLGRKEYRTFAADLVATAGSLGVVEVPRATGHALIAEARRLTELRGKHLPEGASGWLGRQGEPGPLPDLAERFPPLAADEELAALSASGALHALPLLRGWLADEQTLRALAARLDEISVSPVVLDERQRAEQAQQAIASAVAAYFDEERRARWSKRLLAAAGHLADAGDGPHARMAAAAARALAAGRDPLEIPFARMLLEKAFPARTPAASTDPASPAGGGPLIIPG